MTIKKKRLFGSMLLLCLMLIIIFLFIQETNKPILVEMLDNRKVYRMSPEKLIYFDDFEETDFTCTGLTYDPYKKTFWIADYGALSKNATPAPRLVEVNSSFSEVKSIISIANQVGEDANVQGIAYDCSNASIWIATGSDLVNISKNGDILERFGLGKYSRYKANGIAYDAKTDTLWILCFRKYLLNYDKMGNCLSAVKVNLQDQDHICFTEDGDLLASVGADYYGEKNYVVKLDTNTGKVELIYQVLDSFAVEGIYAIDKKLYIVNDGVYHNSKIKKSYLSLYHLDFPPNHK